ncbi:MAG TPA: hypothetical protein VFU15_12305 [Bacteroidia bacterium]|nr:hypothetical protein [Bacteroidia bacterium]
MNARNKRHGAGRKAMIVFAIVLQAVFCIRGKALAIDSAAEKQMIREGSAKLCSIFDINDEAIATGHTEKMQFVVMLGGNEDSADYVIDCQTPNHAQNPLSAGSTQDSLNARIRSIYAQYHVELYMIYISALDVIIHTPLPPEITAANLFGRKLYDEQTNMAELRSLHDNITNAIISNTIAGHHRDCVIHSCADYCGAFFKNAQTGCFTFSMNYAFRAPSSTFYDIDGLRTNFSKRLNSNDTWLYSTGEVKAFAVTDAFRESAEVFSQRANILTTYTSAGLNSILSGFAPGIDYESLSTEERRHIFSVYAGYLMLGDGPLGAHYEDYYTTMVVQYTPPDQVLDLFTLLSRAGSLNNNANYQGEKNTKALIRRLIDRINDAPLGAPNYTRFMLALTDLLKTNDGIFSSLLPQNDEQWKERTFYWDDTYLFSCPPIGTHRYSVSIDDFGTMHVRPGMVTAIRTDYNNAAATPNHTPVWNDSLEEEEIDPFAVVIFKNRSNYGMLEHAGAQRNGVFFAPAIFLQYAADKTFNANALTMVAVSLDVATLTLGPGAVLTAMEAEDLGLAAFEALQSLGSGGNLAANALNDPSVTEVVSTYNEIIAAWGLSNLATHLGTFTVDFISGARAGSVRPIPASLATEFESEYNTAKTYLASNDPNAQQLQKMEEYLEEKVGVVNSTPAGNFNFQYLSLLNGFSDNLDGLLAMEGIDRNTFLVMEGKSAADLTPNELAMMNRIRARIPKPDANTLMQKAVPKSFFEGYLSGQYSSVSGYITSASDAKQFKTFEDIYYGLRLDYNGTRYSLTDEYCGVIRFKASNIEEAYVPRSPANGGTTMEAPPFTGHGFTSGSHGRLGAPEWKMDVPAILKDGAELWQIDANGDETLKAIYDSEIHKFVPVN